MVSCTVRALWRNAFKGPISDQLARYEHLRGYADPQTPMKHHATNSQQDYYRDQ